MKRVELSIDVPMDPKNLRSLSEAKIYEAARGILGEFIPDVGLIVAILDAKLGEDIYRPPTDCRVYLKLRVKALALDVEQEDVYLAEVRTLEGKIVRLAIGEIASGIVNVAHLGPREKYRYDVDPDQGVAVRINRETGEREEYLRPLDVVRAKVTGGIGRRGISLLRFSMVGDRLGPVERIKQKREVALRGEA